MINIRELITQLEKWERDFGPMCEVPVRYENIYEYIHGKTGYPHVSGVSIVGQNEVQIDFE